MSPACVGVMSCCVASAAVVAAAVVCGIDVRCPVAVCLDYGWLCMWLKLLVTVACVYVCMRHSRVCIAPCVAGWPSTCCCYLCTVCWAVCATHCVLAVGAQARRTQHINVWVDMCERALFGLCSVIAHSLVELGWCRYVKRPAILQHQLPATLTHSRQAGVVLQSY